MAEKEDKRLIMKNGERLRIDAKRPKGGGSNKPLPHSFEEVIEVIQRDVNEMAQNIESNPQDFLSDDFVAEIELEPGYTAKSYEPIAMFKTLSLTKVGTRIVKDPNTDDDLRIEFIKLNKEQLTNLPNDMRSHNDDTKSFKEAVQKIKTMRLSSASAPEVFSQRWQGKKAVEIVVHPLANEQVIREFFSSILSKDEDITFRTLEIPNSPIYLFTKITFEEFSRLMKLNPVRSLGSAKVRVLDKSEGRVPLHLELNRNIWTEEMIEKLPVIGIFDGGVEQANKLFSGLVQRTYWDKNRFPVSEFHKRHGSLVAGAAIYGPIADPSSKVELTPKVRVEDIPVLNNDTEENMYKIVDYIKEVVPKIPDIDVFNISFGPEEAISDDHVSYFTAAIDELAYRYQKLFIVATGNDGHARYPDNRIQAPSDGMNVLSVGAFEYSASGDQRVSRYSSIGPGREAAKIKPEIVDLGGASDQPLIFVGEEFFATDPVYGTSFAAPMVATKMAETIAVSPDITPLVAKGLAIQKASPDVQSSNPKIGITKSAGFGFMAESSQNLYYDNDDEVTIIYHDNIDMKGVSRLLVPIPKDPEFVATKYDLTWTIATMTAPNPSSSDAYSDFSITDTLIVDDENIPKDKHRKTRSNTKYVPEQDLRSSDFKWDTVVKKKVTVQSTTMATPYVEISGLSRTTQSTQRIEFAIIITLKAYKNSEPLSEAILNEYGVLQPLTLSETLSAQIDA